ncbi:replication initiator [Cryptosporangium aurantiacum]|uniref:replication initiator n=1 Tax=Cryptosporangium aurantiacum TaxID=134849 RepID=UPI003CCBEC7A
MQRQGAVDTRTPFTVPGSTRLPKSATRAEHAFQRASEPEYDAWISHVRPAAACSHPVRLAGEVATFDTRTGALLSSVQTADLPDGEIYKPCGNRRTEVCPSCAETYRGDAYQLIRTGLVGGRGVPESVNRHPAVFLTLTAPSFGLVHTRRTGKDNRALRCRPRRIPELCPHGVDLRCDRIHDADERALGLPLCLDCYDHDHQVVWNHHASELWRRTTIALNRELRRIARSRGISPRLIRLAYGKVAEFQRRGVVHFHVIVRLDGVDPLDKDAILPPPAELGLTDLAGGIAHAHHVAGLFTEPHPANPNGWPIAWGEQVDARPLRLDGGDAITDGMVAGYLAKYATKSTETTGHLSRRLTTDTIDLHADPAGTHVERLVDACWTLGGPRGWGLLRRWAHMLGFGGHFLTKSRRYSVTFRVLRERRIIWARTQAAELADEHQLETTLVVGLLQYAGSGWRTTGDAMLANTAAAQAREYARIAREEIAHEDAATSA